MKTIIPGVHYIAEGSKKNVQHTLDIIFCHKDESGNFIDGTTNEELINIMIQRYIHLVTKVDSPENIQCLTLLRQVKLVQQSRMDKKMIKTAKNDNPRNSI